MPGEIILERSKCIACKELPEDKVLQCKNGHIHCDPCFSTTRPCGVCEETTPCEIRNTFAEQELDSLELDCDHKVNGCEIKVGWKELRGHVETCIFRQLVPLCSQMGLNCPFPMPRDNVQAVVDHFRENHQFQEAPVGTPISLILADFQKVCKLELATTNKTVIWPPLLVKSVMGVKLNPLFTVLHVRTTTTTTTGADNSLSVVAISLSDLYPVGGPSEIQPRAQFSIKCPAGGGRRVPNLGWTVDPFPSMNSSELLSKGPFRHPISLLLPRFVGSDGSLKIEVQISPGTSSPHQNEEEVPENIISIRMERVVARDSLSPRLEEPQRQYYPRSRGESSGSPTGNGGANNGRTTIRGPRSRGGGATHSGSPRGRGNGAGPSGSSSGST